ncbi:GGDEF domain-containing protein [Aliagarivorans marinus]|uniref:GGDEF domain-containing protein n=1 Tax=Aliagarivorans marinus TaxID=561965 RepID=UPI00040FFB42|nr:GGDEF domain-containing protein [Aliagarivorans marinus]
MDHPLGSSLSLAILDILPNPVLVKGSDLRYVWVNKAFEELFAVQREQVIGQLDVDIFPDRQAAQCNGGDLRVLSSGKVDEAYETVLKDGVTPCITITRKSRLSMGDMDFLVGVMHDITDVTETNRELEQAKQLLEAQSSKLEKMAYSDPLTGVLNRRRLEQLADAAFASHHHRGCVLLSDLDHFKRVNDQWGHDAGDAALIHFVEIVQSVFRDSDRIARIGGEEFACLLPGADKQQGWQVAERMREALESSPLDYKGEQIPMTVSSGMVVLAEGEAIQLAELLSRADKCLYQAKQTGRNKTVCE